MGKHSEKTFRKELTNSQEPHGFRLRAGKMLAKLCMAAVCIIPPADFAVSDTGSAKAYEVVQEKTDLESEALERAVEVAALGTLMISQSIVLGQVITRNKKAHNAFEDFNAYLEERQANMGKFRKMISKTVTAPFAAMEKMGKGFERLGEKASQRKTRTARMMGKLLVETGRVNAIGTSGVISQETMAGKPTSLGRQFYLGGLIAGTWLGAAEIIRQIYRTVPVTRPPLAAIGKTFELLTTVDMAHPTATPIGSLAVGLTVAGLARTGWKIEEFRQRQEGEPARPYLTN